MLAGPAPPYVVAGLGRAGTAAVAALLQRVDPSLIAAWDGAVAPGSGDVLDELRQRGVRTELGTDGTALLDGGARPRTIVVSPGLPDDLPLLERARARGLTLLDEAELGRRFDARPWVGVTGTNGKSTSARLLAEVLRANGIEPVLGGNTHAAPPLSGLGPSGDVVVAEISSFQLERTEHLVADAALLTNVGTDHLDRHGTRAAYAATKERLFLRDDVHAAVAAITADDQYSRVIRGRLRKRGARVLTFGVAPDADVRVTALDWDLDGSVVGLSVLGVARRQPTRLPGPHNAANVAGVVALASVLDLDMERSAEAIAANERATRAHDAGRTCVRRLRRLRQERRRRARGARNGRSGRPPSRESSRRGGVRDATGRPRRRVRDGGCRGAGADRLFVTVDRWDASTPPEPSAELVRGVRSALAEAEVVTDRRAALAAAVATAAPGDIVVVLGRTPTPMPSVAADGSVVLFDDAAALRALLSG